MNDPALSDLIDAARGARNVFSELAVDGGRTMLGWVEPPPWDAVATALERALHSPAIASADAFVICGTGGWIHAARAAAGDALGRGIFAVDSLDPAALAEALTAAGDRGRIACIGISTSMQTLETRLLVDTVAEALGGDERVLWLSSAEIAGAVPLTIDGKPNINALFGSPLTLAYLLPLAIARGVGHAEREYRAFLARRGEWIDRLWRQAATIGNAIYFRSGQAGVDEWLLQLGRQALSAKSESFRPTAESGGGDAPSRFDTVDLAGTGPMEAMHAAQFFVAALACRHRINFAAHDEVHRYKQRVDELLRSPESLDYEAVASATIDESFVPGDDVEVVIYRHLGRALPRGFHEGSAWNHHSYQAAVASVKRYVIVEPACEHASIPGVADEAAARNVRALRAIARATRETLGIRARAARWNATINEPLPAP